MLAKQIEGKPGDFLMKGVEGELYVCDKEIFEQSYEFTQRPKAYYVAVDKKTYDEPDDKVDELVEKIIETNGEHCTIGIRVTRKNFYEV